MTQPNFSLHHSIRYEGLSLIKHGAAPRPVTYIRFGAILGMCRIYWDIHAAVRAAPLCYCLVYTCALYAPTSCLEVFKSAAEATISVKAHDREGESVSLSSLPVHEHPRSLLVSHFCFYAGFFTKILIYCVGFIAHLFFCNLANLLLCFWDLQPHCDWILFFLPPLNPHMVLIITKPAKNPIDSTTISLSQVKARSTIMCIIC